MTARLPDGAGNEAIGIVEAEGKSDQNGLGAGALED